MSSSFFAALYSAFGKYDVVHIHAEGPAFFSWLPKMFGKRVVVTIHGIDWQREKWKSGFGSKFIRQGEKNAVKYADEIIVLSKGVQDYFEKTYLSFEMKMAKPEPEIFKAIIEDAGIEPKETLFIDDSEMNCKTAQNLGISTYTAKVGEDWSHLFNLK